MDALGAYVLGVLTGLTIYWLIYRLFWRRWRNYLVRDMAYLQAKVKSADDTKFALERQINVLKADIGGLRTKINDLERENRQAQARLDETNSAKQALISHLEALRGVLEAYKKLATEHVLPAPAPSAAGLPVLGAHVLSANGKGLNGNGSNGKGLNGNGANGKGVNGNGAVFPGMLPLEQHSNGKNHSLASGEDPVKVFKVTPEKTPYNGALKNYLVPDPLIDIVEVIGRPAVFAARGDRLEIISGIGPVIARKLCGAGIDTFQALSTLSPEKLKDLVGPRAAKLMDAESVIAQARKLVGERKPRQ